MTKVSTGLAGRGFLQSPKEWEVRNRVLAHSLSELANHHLPPVPDYGLDVGCQTGDLTDYLNEHTAMSWQGIDPILSGPTTSPRGASLLPAAADSIPFSDGRFDCLLLANVFEHIPLGKRQASFEEMYRVMKPGGILVGQIPNPYFPIESHSRLPFMGWLPVGLQKKYWRLSPVPWGHDFYVVTPRDLREYASKAGFEVIRVRNFNYPPEALPRAVRPLGTILQAPMRRFPWAWQFVLRRPEN